MLERQREGIGKAKGEGRYLGRKQEIDTLGIWRRVLAGEGATTIARALGRAKSSVYQHMPTGAELAAVTTHDTVEKQDVVMRALVAQRTAVSRTVRREERFALKPSLTADPRRSA